MGTDDGHRHAILDGIARVERFGQMVDAVLYGLGQCAKFLPADKLHVLLAEIQFQFHQAGKVEQLLAQTGQFGTDSAPHLIDGQTMGGCRIAGDEVGHSLGLGKVEFPVEEGPLGEFSWFGHTGTAGNEQLHHTLQDVPAAMAVEFHTVLSGVGIGGMEDGGQHFVDKFFASIRGGGDYMAETELVGCFLGQCLSLCRPEHTVGDDQRVGAAKTNDTDGTTCGGGYGYYCGVVHDTEGCFAGLNDGGCAPEWGVGAIPVPAPAGGCSSR